MERKINARSGAIYAGQASGVEARNPQSSPDLLAIGWRRPSGRWSHFSNQNIHKALPLPISTCGALATPEDTVVLMFLQTKKDGTFKTQNELFFSTWEVLFGT